MRNFEASIPGWILHLPISQAADITAFTPTTVRVGEDRCDDRGQTQEIVHKFYTFLATALVSEDYAAGAMILQTSAGFRWKSDDE